MSNSAEIVIRLDAKGQREVRSALKGVGTETKDLTGSVGGLTKGFNMLGPVIGTIGFGALAKSLYDVNAEFQRLNASLVTVTGSQAAANREFSWLRDFATTTPFQLNQIVDAFIKMEAMGLSPTEESLRSFGNTASGMGKDLNQMIEAVADAATGEFERLKEFGIKASKQADQVTFTFRGLKTTVKAEAAAITGYLQQLGEVEFAGGMIRQMDTLGGAMSNLSDNWDKLLVTIGESGGNDVAITSMGLLSTAIKDAGNSYQWLTAMLKGQISISEFLFTTDEDEAAARLKEIAAQGGKLVALQRTVAGLTQQKNSTPFWSTFQEESLQQATSALTAYRDELELTRLAQNYTGSRGAVAPEEPSATPQTFAPDPYDTALAVAAGNATEDDMWLKRLGLDQAAIERAKTAKLELQEWMREQDLLEAEQMTDLWLLREEGKFDADMRGIQLEQQREDKLTAIALRGLSDRAKFEKLSAQDRMRFALGDMVKMTQAAAANNKTMFRINQAARVLEAGQSAVTGAIKTWNTYPYPWNIPMTALHIAGSAMYMKSLVGGSQQGGETTIGGYGGGTPTSPTVTTPAAEVEQQETRQAPVVNIHIPDGVRVIDKTALEEFARELVEPLAKAANDGVR